MALFVRCIMIHGRRDELGTGENMVHERDAGNLKKIKMRETGNDSWDSAARALGVKVLEA